MDEAGAGRSPQRMARFHRKRSGMRRRAACVEEGCCLRYGFAGVRGELRGAGLNRCEVMGRLGHSATGDGIEQSTSGLVDGVREQARKRVAGSSCRCPILLGLPSCWRSCRLGMNDPVEQAQPLRKQQGEDKNRRPAAANNRCRRGRGCSQEGHEHTSRFSSSRRRAGSLHPRLLNPQLCDE